MKNTGHVIILCVLMLAGNVICPRGLGRRHGGNECEKGTLKCHPDADCIDSRRSSRCRCRIGYAGDGLKCVDKNECFYKNGGCVHYCYNSKGSYACGCREGFQLALDGKNCIDKNECFTDKGGCQQSCHNTLGGFECQCSQGYSLDLDEKSCKLGTWCQTRKGCAHYCRTTPDGAVVCDCKKGYTLHSNGKDCIQTCSAWNGGCQHNCTDTSKGPRCSCVTDYILTPDDKTCVATCMVNNGGCQKRCKDTPSGPVCSCPEGYQLHQDQKSCLDVNECQENNGGCGYKCVNTDGGYECICQSGYKVQADQKTCEDINECELATACDHICINTPGSYFCACRPGYDNFGFSHCADKNECSYNNGGCEQGCSNSIGSYTCLCDNGKLHQNKKDCIPKNKCYELRSPPGAEQMCKVEGLDTVCILKCKGEGRFTTATDQSVVTTHCGHGTQYQWDHDVKNTTLPSCSTQVKAPDLSREVLFKFLSKRCRRRKSLRLLLAHNITDTLNADTQFKCRGLCSVPNPVELRCDKLPSNRRGQMARYSISVQFKLKKISAISTKKKQNCDVACQLKKTERSLKKIVKNMKKSIHKSRFIISYAGDAYTVGKKTMKSPRGNTLSCQPNWMLLGASCVGCAKGSYYVNQEKTCKLCPPSFYQDAEVQNTCKPCPGNPPGVGIYGATSEEECHIQCEPGHYSYNGMKPCKPCPLGLYQPEYGRLSCMPCKGGLTTKSTGSVNFKDCQTVDTCTKGHFYDLDKHACVACPRGFYQPKEGQNYCIQCPQDATTDDEAATDRNDCKSRVCGEVFSKKTLQGVLESPNYPGEYPTNVSCVWKIKPSNNRRILVIIPDVELPKEDKCGDKLVMRKSKNPYSTVTYETCETGDRPIAFTARSKRLWIQFQSDQQNTAKGFSIPFVTYNAEYQRLIEDIVQDGRLYSSFQHQSVLKDRKLLNALMEVIAQPYNYFKYANISRTIIPHSFIKLVRKKVIRFFRP